KNSFTLSNQPFQELQQWNFSIEPKMLQVRGRKLGPEKIHFKTAKVTVDEHTEEWGSACKTNAVVSSIPLKSWLLLYINRNKDQAQVCANFFFLSLSDWVVGVLKEYHQMWKADWIFHRPSNVSVAHVWVFFLKKKFTLQIHSTA